MTKKKIIEQLKDDPLMPLRHSAEHVLHIAMQELHPALKKVMGPPIEDGFYFDFDLDGAVSPEDFPKIEALMQEIVDAKLDIKKIESSAEEARKIYKNNKYKLDTIDEIEKRGEKLTLYQIGEDDGKHYDLDLCSGPHVKNTKEIAAFKLLSVAGAYYKGTEKNKMLQRIYGTAFDSKEKLQEFLKNQELAKARDHRKLGQELELFTFAEDVGPGLPLWLPKGNIIREEIEKWAIETEKEWGYVRVSTPHIGKSNLYLTSGHLPYYKDDMFSAIDVDGEEYYLKGMNCPHHHMIYKSKQRSYKELPLRMAEYGMVYRYEPSGTLFGLMRVRALEQNDAHIYCAEEDAEEEFLQALKLHEHYYNMLGLTKNDYFLVIGLPDEEKRDKYHGDKKIWAKAEKMMRNAIEKSGISAREDVGGAAFYGPKIDVQVTSSIGREFTLATNQVDFAQPRRFNLTYTDAKGKPQIPLCIHRAPLGTHERFIGFLIEHYAGIFPLWLAPVQVRVLPISDKHLAYARTVAESLITAGVRAEVNDRSESLGKQIREAELNKVPYMLVIGDKEKSAKTVAIRHLTRGDLGTKSVGQLIKLLRSEITTRK